jgi:hypothetical protein
MKIELKNLKINERLSEETTCFSATVYVNGKRAFEAGNRGHGGCNEYKGAYEAAAAYAATLPPYTGVVGSIPYDLDMLIDDLIEAERFERALKHDLKRVAFVDGGKYYVTKAAATPDMIAAVVGRYPTATILNTMPIADAVALCRSIGL